MKQWFVDIGLGQQRHTSIRRRRQDSDCSAQDDQLGCRVFQQWFTGFLNQSIVLAGVFKIPLAAAF